MNNRLGLIFLGIAVSWIHNRALASDMLQVQPPLPSASSIREEKKQEFNRTMHTLENIANLERTSHPETSAEIIATVATLHATAEEEDLFPFSNKLAEGFLAYVQGKTTQREHLDKDLKLLRQIQEVRAATRVAQEKIQVLENKKRKPEEPANTEHNNKKATAAPFQNADFDQLPTIDDEFAARLLLITESRESRGFAQDNAQLEEFFAFLESQLAHPHFSQEQTAINALVNNLLAAAEQTNEIVAGVSDRDTEEYDMRLEYEVGLIADTMTEITRILN